MERFEADHKTIYEIIFPASSLGVDLLTAGYEFAFSVAVNDGDTDVPGHTGQKGWSGWAVRPTLSEWRSQFTESKRCCHARPLLTVWLRQPYSIMYGKQAENTGLARLIDNGGTDALVAKFATEDHLQSGAQTGPGTCAAVCRARHPCCQRKACGPPQGPDAL
jgi:hypothetical protein